MKSGETIVFIAVCRSFVPTLFPRFVFVMILRIDFELPVLHQNDKIQMCLMYITLNRLEITQLIIKCDSHLQSG